MAERVGFVRDEPAVLYKLGRIGTARTHQILYKPEYQVQDRDSANAAFLSRLKNAPESSQLTAQATSHGVRRPSPPGSHGALPLSDTTLLHSRLAVDLILGKPGLAHVQPLP